MKIPGTKVKKINQKFVKIKESEDLLKVPDNYLANKSAFVEQESPGSSFAEFLNLPGKNKTKKEIKIKSKKIKNQEVVTPKYIVNAYNPDLNKGLTKEEVDLRYKANLFNFLPPKTTKKLASIIFFNIFSIFNIIMLIMVFILIYAKASASNYLFLFAVISNSSIYIVQEIKAKKIIDKLSLKTTGDVIAVRDGVEYQIKPSEIVYNDIVLLKVGMPVPCDLIIRSDEPIEVNESILTGESDSCLKKKGDLIYAGSYIITGLCLAQAVVLGSDTYIEKLTIAAKKYQKPKSQIINSMNFLIKILAVVVVILGALLFWLTLKGIDPNISRTNFNEKLISGVGALVGMIPAGLIVLTSLALAVGVIRLSQSNTLVQELSCIEMLARTDTLCLDKTGTITDGTMNVVEIIEINKSSDKKMDLELIMMSILNNLQPENATDKALFDRFGNKSDLEAIAKIPFSSKRKYSLISFKNSKTFILGAPEFVLKEKYHEVSDKTEKAYRSGLRVLALAETDSKIEPETLRGFKGQANVLALIILEDRIRPDAVETIEYFKQAGVDVKVISGDNPVSVSRIAQKVGINDAHKYISLEDMTELQIQNIATEYTVFGRVTPDQKKYLVKALKASGRTIAMTGDGVNDLLALKEADTSIAMASGSEAARNISNLVLLDSNFSSMPKVVREGRRVINNIKKVATIFVTKTIFSIMLTALTILVLLIMGPGTFQYPIKPAQLLVIDWFIVGVPSFFLAMENNDIKVEKTNFLRDVFKAALPGAISIVISSILFYLIKFATSLFNQQVESTIIVYGALSIFMFVLYQNCKPFNLMRILLLSIMYTGIITGCLFVPELYNLTPIINVGYGKGIPMTKEQILILVIMILSGYPIAYIITNIGKWINIIKDKTKQKKLK